MLRCGNVRRLSAKRVAVADDREKSDSAKVAGETDEQSGPNRSGAGGAKGGAGGDAKQQSTDWAQNRATMSHALERVRGAATLAFCPSHPRWERVQESCPTRIWVGGRLAMIVPTELRSEPTGPTRPSRNRGHCNNIVEVTAQ